jgi:hypothetical protein
MTDSDPARCRKIAAECRENALPSLLTQVIEIAVNEALGEVARQQGGITPPTDREAYNAGIACGRSALRTVLRQIMPEVAHQLEAAAPLMEQPKTTTSSLSMPKEGSTSPHLTIRVCRRSDDFHASLEGQRGVWGCGPGSDAAIGDLVRSHPEMFGIKIDDLV